MSLRSYKHITLPVNKKHLNLLEIVCLSRLPLGWGNSAWTSVALLCSRTKIVLRKVKEMKNQVW